MGEKARAEVRGGSSRQPEQPPAIPWGGKEPEPEPQGGMKLDVVPVAVVSNGSDVSARVTAKLHVDDSHHLSLEADDSSFRDGLSKKGMTVGFCKKGAFDMHYGLDADAPKFLFNTSATVLDKDVALRFRHALKGDTDLRPHHLRLPRPQVSERGCQVPAQRRLVRRAGV